ncbi:protein FD-like protein [Carex littledalei]|uniref:Protein FD-like protein n=1 Tax=Carex littledalei TaxID=544730 RepID=A0A833QGR2_9POAL|nr:protein FD-like protein [Carex littledalei]
MWCSEQDSNTTNPNPRNHTSGSSSSLSRSSPSSKSSMMLPQTPRRSMEDVWKDISLMTPLQNQYHQNHHLSDKSNPSFKGMILQDFLAGPLNRPVSISPPVDHQASPPIDHAAWLPPIPTPNLPPTSLSLNSGHEFGYLGNSLSSNSSSGDSRATGRATGTSSIFSPGLSDLIMDPALPQNIHSFYSKKRPTEVPAIGGDRRQKRMIKNRESAARSRARKQAVSNELERKVQNLSQENEELRQQCNELQLKIDGKQQCTKRGLRRNGSSTF